MSRGKQVFARGGAINDRFRFSRDVSGCEREQVLGGGKQGESKVSLFVLTESLLSYQEKTSGRTEGEQRSKLSLFFSPETRE